jgi:hypothetical protein
MYKLQLFENTEKIKRKHHRMTQGCVVRAWSSSVSLKRRIDLVMLLDDPSKIVAEATVFHEPHLLIFAAVDHRKTKEDFFFTRRVNYDLPRYMARGRNSSSTVG